MYFRKITVANWQYQWQNGRYSKQQCTEMGSTIQLQRMTNCWVQSQNVFTTNCNDIMKKKGTLYDLNWKYSIYPIKSSDIMKENNDKQFTCNQELWPLYGVYSKQHRWWITKSKYLICVPVTNVMTSWRKNMRVANVIRNFNLLRLYIFWTIWEGVVNNKLTSLATKHMQGNI